jgi:kynurenine formamidase
MKIVDLSLTIKNSPPEIPAHQATQIEYSDHLAGARSIEQMFGVPPQLLRRGEGWAVERFTSFGTHNSTHVDAPWHYNSVVEGQPAATIDELPLEWFFGPGVKLDLRHKAEGDAATADDLAQAVERAGHTLEPRDIVLVQTGCDRFLDQPDYMLRGCGVSAEATHWLYERGIRVMGIDAWGWDRPLDRQARDAVASQRSGVFWQAHQADLAYSQIERLVGLDQLPSTGFKVACFPLKIERGSGAPARVVALLD